MHTIPDPVTFLKQLFDTAVASAEPGRCLAEYLPPPVREGQTLVVGAGKGSAAMAAAVEEAWTTELSGVVITPYGHGCTCHTIDIIEAAHPVPDEAGLGAAARILEMTQALRSGDQLLCLLSGGGSALLTLPADGLPFQAKQEINSQLLKSGADITQINCVRKHLSGIKGGRLAAAAWPASTVSLMISDVAGDDPAVIASGPTTADPTTCRDALEIITRHNVQIPADLEVRLANGSNETPKPGAVELSRASHQIIASAKGALQAVSDRAGQFDFEVLNLGDEVIGESRHVGREHGQLFRRLVTQSSPGQPLLLISGGETTVTIHGQGQGGPNREYLLALAIELDSIPNVWAIACDTDGLDGNHDAAGAIIGPVTLKRASRLGLNPDRMLNDNDAGSFFAALDDAVVTGPTRTNINDLRILAYIPPS
jgi:hydroxypyruvate reductase